MKHRFIPARFLALTLAVCVAAACTVLPALADVVAGSYVGPTEKFDENPQGNTVEVNDGTIKVNAGSVGGMFTEEGKTYYYGGNRNTIGSNTGSVLINQPDGPDEADESKPTIVTNESTGTVGVADSNGNPVGGTGNFSIIGTNAGTVTLNAGADDRPADADLPEDIVAEEPVNEGGEGDGAGASTYTGGSILTNTGTVIVNKGTIIESTETGTVGLTDSSGIPVEGTGNFGKIETNYGTVTLNAGANDKPAGSEDLDGGEEVFEEGEGGGNGQGDGEGESTYKGGTILTNKGTVAVNRGNIDKNAGTVGVTDSSGKPVEGTGNFGTIVTNTAGGTVTTNAASGTIGKNAGTVTDNYGGIVINEQGGTVTNNNKGGTIVTNAAGGTITNNTGLVGMLEEGKLVEGSGNYGFIGSNTGMVLVNADKVENNNKGGTIVVNVATVVNNNEGGVIYGNAGTVESNAGTINSNSGMVGSADENGMKSGNTGTVTTNNAGGIVLNLTDGTVTTNNGFVYNFGGTVTTNTDVGTEYFSVEVINTTDHTEDNSKDLNLPEAYGKQWLGQVGTTPKTATVKLIPKTNFEITAVDTTDFEGKVEASPNDDGTWTLTITSGANAKIIVPESSEKTPQTPQTETDSPSGGGGGSDEGTTTQPQKEDSPSSGGSGGSSGTPTPTTPTTPSTPETTTKTETGSTSGESTTTTTKTETGSTSGDSTTKTTKTDPSDESTTKTTKTDPSGESTTQTTKTETGSKPDDVEVDPKSLSLSIGYSGSFTGNAIVVSVSSEVSLREREATTHQAYSATNATVSDISAATVDARAIGTGWTAAGDALSFGTTAESGRQGALFVTLENKLVSGGLRFITNLRGSDGTIAWGAGTTGKSKRLEALTLKLPNDVAGGIEYRAHVERSGWVKAYADGAAAGTTGKSKRLEAVRIRLSGEMAEGYSVWYRVHSQTYGWLGWAKDGEDAGTTGLSRRAEAIDVQVLPQGQVPTGYDASKAACVSP